jgi:transaldolase
MSESLAQLSQSGVSIWLDDLSRDRLQSGSLADLIENSYVVGVTTNPSIFSAAISGSSLYKEDILALKAEGLSTAEIVTELTTSDVRQACDLFSQPFSRAIKLMVE